ncbi:MAG: hypothetical protein ACM3XN_07210 [Chloroflexota bacterium]
MNIPLRPLLRLTFPWNAALSLPALLIAPLVGALTGVRHSPTPLVSALRLLELTATAVAIIAFAHLMVIDSEERALELRFTYPPQRWLLVGERLIPAVAILCLGTLGGWAILRTAAPALTARAALVAALPPALALTGVAFLAGCLAGNAWVAAAVSLAWWGLAYFTSRAVGSAPLVRFLVNFHLFQTGRPVGGVAYATNRWLLLLVAAACLTGCIIRVSARESWLGRQ